MIGNTWVEDGLVATLAAAARSSSQLLLHKQQNFSANSKNNFLLGK